VRIIGPNFSVNLTLRDGTVAMASRQGVRVVRLSDSAAKVAPEAVRCVIWIGGYLPLTPG
jgi:hypothetical protein